MSSFVSWLSDNEAHDILIEAILDQWGNPLNVGDDVSARQKFETEEDGKICLVGYQGYQQHNPMLQAFAQKNADNFAQTVLFGPLTANTVFSRFNEWFPVLIHFLRQKDKVTQSEVASFVSGVDAQRLGKELERSGTPMNNRGDLASIADRGQGFKTEFVAKVWNNRHKLYEKAMRMAADGEWTELMKEFAQLPGVQPVKAGFIVQLVFGQLGCIDIHNLRMYSSLADVISSDPEAPKDMKEKWQDLKQMLKGNAKGVVNAWAIDGKNRKGGAARIDAAVEAYSKVLAHMKNELGITPRVLWDLWVNYVAQAYSGGGANVYSPEQGKAYGEDDEQLTTVLGGKDRQWGHFNRKAWAIQPHPTSGAVSRVHLMAAISPEDLVREIENEMHPADKQRFHFVNAAIRNDPEVRPALFTLASRIMDAAKLKEMVASGRRVNKALAFAAERNEAAMERLSANAQNAVNFVLRRKYGMNQRDAEELTMIYVGTLKKIARRHLEDIRSTLRIQATKQGKADGTYVDDDEQLGYGADSYDPDAPFDTKAYAKSLSGGTDPTKIGRLASKIEPYVGPMSATLSARKKSEQAETKHLDKLRSVRAAANDARRSLSVADRRAVKTLASLQLASKHWEDRQGDSLTDRDARLRKQAKAKLNAAREEHRESVKAKQKLERELEKLEAEMAELQHKITQPGLEFQQRKQDLLDRQERDIAQKRSVMRKRLHGIEDDFQDS